MLFLEIQTDEGSTCKLPYNQIDQHSIELNFQKSKSGESLIKVVLDCQLDEDKTLKKIHELVINTPWCSHKSEIRINAKPVDDKYKVYEISCKTNSEQGNKRIKELVEKEFISKSK